MTVTSLFVDDGPLRKRLDLCPVIPRQGPLTGQVTLSTGVEEFPVPLGDDLDSAIGH